VWTYVGLSSMAIVVWGVQQQARRPAPGKGQWTFGATPNRCPSPRGAQASAAAQWPGSSRSVEGRGEVDHARTTNPAQINGLLSPDCKLERSLEQETDHEGMQSSIKPEAASTGLEQG